ncbi:MAG: OB-fold putative lipoprotein [Planctomycetota bacterium]|nr:OB-fold putative lipoprotein [Planctomycetota bacterium]
MNDHASQQNSNAQAGGGEVLTPDEAWFFRKFLPISVPAASMAVILLIGWFFFGFGLGLLYAMGFPLACCLGMLVLSRYRRGQGAPPPIAQPTQPHISVSPQAGLAPSSLPPGYMPPWERGSRAYAPVSGNGSEQGFFSSSIRIALKGIVGLILIGVIVFGVLFVLYLAGSAMKRQESSVKSEEPAARLLATKIMAEYEANEVGADARYKDKVVEVTGEVNHVGKDLFNDPYVTLKTDNVLLSVQCFFKEKDAGQLGSLSKGLRVNIRGRCDGKMGNVILKDCELGR